MTCRTVGGMFCTKMMSYKTSFCKGSAFVFFFQTGSKAARPVSIPAASPSGLRQMEHFVAAWFLPRAYAALEVISLSDKSPELLWV